MDWTNGLFHYRNVGLFFGLSFGLLDHFLDLFLSKMNTKGRVDRYYLHLRGSVGCGGVSEWPRNWNNDRNGIAPQLESSVSKLKEEYIDICVFLKNGQNELKVLYLKFSFTSISYEVTHVLLLHNIHMCSRSFIMRIISLIRHKLSYKIQFYLH